MDKNIDKILENVTEWFLIYQIHECQNKNREYEADLLVQSI
jgi:hypothetical protein